MSSKYMQRKRPRFISKGEIARDYHRHDLSPSDFILLVDWDDSSFNDFNNEEDC